MSVLDHVLQLQRERQIVEIVDRHIDALRERVLAEIQLLVAAASEPQKENTDDE